MGYQLGTLFWGHIVRLAAGAVHWGHGVGLTSFGDAAGTSIWGQTQCRAGSTGIS